MADDKYTFRETEEEKARQEELLTEVLQACMEEQLSFIPPEGEIAHLKEALDASGEDYRMMILPDHPTPICVRTHTSDPIPYLLYDSRKAFAGSAGVYNEKAAQAGGIEVMYGYELIDKLFEEK